MRKLRKQLVYSLLITIGLTAQAQEKGDTTLLINELMQSNIDCIMDDLNEFPDSWVELYNTTGGAVNLKDYKLGVTPEASEAWALPDKVLGSKLRALVYCDKAASGMHTNFRLESGKGCEVYLFRGDELVDKVTGLKKQPAPNIAYGRAADGSSEWGYQLTTTPLAPNLGGICGSDHILGEPVFSQKGRVATDNRALSLELSLPSGTPEEAFICYTTDGSEPVENSTRYDRPITISSTRVIRAKIFCKGWLSPRSTTHSYIFFPRELTLPVVSITTNSRYLYDTKVGIYTDGTYSRNMKNYEYDWRRPIQFEYFEDAGQPSILNQLCETRIMGGATRSNMMKSLAVYANKRFGTKRLEYEFFPDQKPGLTDFKSICLRNAGNDFDYLYMRDAVIQRTMASHADLDWQAYRPVIVYINGVYKGMLNIRERSNDDNIYTNYDGLEDIDMFENWYELKEGDWENYNQFKSFYGEHGHTMEEYEQWMDCREFINLMAMNIYFNNQDFPGNNIVMWRPRAEGGRWRWIAKDTDFGLGLYGSSANYNTVEWLYNPNYDRDRSWANQYEHTRLFRRLMEDEDFKREFIDRMAIYMGDFLNEKGTRAVWDPMYEKVKFEYPYHRELINRWWPNYAQELGDARNWLKQRTAQVYTHLGSYYRLGNPISMSINKGVASLDSAAITFNGVRLSESVFDGKFYAGRDIHLEGQSDGDWAVTGWRVVTVANGSVETKQVEGSQLNMTMPSCSNLAIIALFADGATGISAVSQSLQPDAVYDLSGRKLRTGTTSLEGLPKGIYLVGGKKVAQY